MPLKITALEIKGREKSLHLKNLNFERWYWPLAFLKLEFRDVTLLLIFFFSQCGLNHAIRGYLISFLISFKQGISG